MKEEQKLYQNLSKVSYRSSSIKLEDFRPTKHSRKTEKKAIAKAMRTSRKSQTITNISVQVQLQPQYTVL